MSDGIEVAPHEILRLNREGGAKMNEGEFVRTWLLTLREYIAGGDVKIVMWLDANKISTFSEVTITDNSGNPLYNVPSIFIKQDRILPANVTSNIGDIMYRVENMNKTIPGKGDSFIQNEVTDHVIQHDKLPSYQKRWDEIFTRYNLEPVFAVNSTSVSIGDNEGFDDYDEL